MEGKGGVNDSGCSVRSDEDPGSFQVGPSSELIGSTAAATPAAPASVAATSTEVKKKRGRPKKYGPDGSVRLALSPMPISASIPLTGDYSAWKHSAGQPIGSFKKKKKKFLLENPGNEFCPFPLI